MNIITNTILIIQFLLPFIFASPHMDQRSGSNHAHDTLRILSYNIHHCNPPTKPGDIDVNAIATVIRQQKPHLVALQEVDVNTKRSGHIDQAGLLAEALNMNVFFAKAIDHDGGEYGIAILSAFPLSEERSYQLPMEEQGEPRVLATVKINLPSGQFIRFASTHLDAQRSGKNQVAQMKEINRIVATDSIPFIIGGDFNSTPTSEAFEIFSTQFQSTCVTCDFTFPQINASRTIDYIGFSPHTSFEVISHQAIPEPYASDHLPILAVLTIK